MRQAFGISYASMALVFSLARAEGGMGAPLVGWLVDRFGSRPMVLFGGLFAGLGMVLLSRADTYWQLILFYVGVISIGKTTGLGQTLMATVNQWFIRRKALAFSTLMTAFGGGGAILVPLLALGNSTVGWRDTLMYSGLFIMLLTLPASYVIRSRPEDLGLLPDGDRPDMSGRDMTRSDEGTKTRMAPGDFTVRHALRTRTFWLMVVGVMTRVSVTNAIVILQIPILVWKGVDEQTAALYVSLMFFLAIPLRFVLGVSGGYLPPRKLLFGGMSMGAVALLAMLVLNGTPAVLIFIVGLAIVEGVTTVNWIMFGDYFGRSRFASLMGMISVFHNVGMVTTPIFSGWIFDKTQSYELVLITFLPLYLLGGLAFATATRPTLPRAPAPASPQPSARSEVGG